MKSAEFLANIAANANKTKNLRSYFGPWPSSINRVPDEIAGKFGRIVSFVQAHIDAGHFCNKETEYLLIYNFQPLHLSRDNIIYYSLDLLRKPTSRIKRVKEKTGEPMQLVIHGTTGEVMNNSKFMVDTGLATVEEIAIDKLERPTIYGNYKAYPAPCCFAALMSDEPLSAEGLFDGVYDQTKAVQECPVFENLLEARHVLAESKAVGRCIIEITDTIEAIPHLKKQGLALQAVKFMDYVTNTVIVSTHPRVLVKEEPIEDELTRLEAAFGMVEVPSIKLARLAAAKSLDPTGKDKSDLDSEINLLVDPVGKETKKVKSQENAEKKPSTKVHAKRSSSSLAHKRAASSPTLSSLFSSLASVPPLASFTSSVATSSSSALISPVSRKRRILIVEDNVVNQKMLTRILTSAGHECHVANDGIEALAAYDQFTFDIIFMDIVMPRMDGLTATQEIRKREAKKSLPKTPIIAITANALQQDREEGRKVGIDHYIAKPFTKSELYAHIMTLNSPEEKADSAPVTNTLSASISSSSSSSFFGSFSAAPLPPASSATETPVNLEPKAKAEKESKEKGMDRSGLFLSQEQPSTDFRHENRDKDDWIAPRMWFKNP